jgi:hypothetical protein
MRLRVHRRRSIPEERTVLDITVSARRECVLLLTIFGALPQ